MDPLLAVCLDEFWPDIVPGQYSFQVTVLGPEAVNAVFGRENFGGLVFRVSKSGRRFFTQATAKISGVPFQHQWLKPSFSQAKSGRKTRHTAAYDYYIFWHVLLELVEMKVRRAADFAPGGLRIS
jgi:hypothetical protein